MRHGCEDSGEKIARRSYSKRLPSVFSKAATSLYRSRPPNRPLLLPHARASYCFVCPTAQRAMPKATPHPTTESQFARNQPTQATKAFSIRATVLGMALSSERKRSYKIFGINLSTAPNRDGAPPQEVIPLRLTSSAQRFDIEGS
jgi:hypothetical protein